MSLLVNNVIPALLQLSLVVLDPSVVDYRDPENSVDLSVNKCSGNGMFN